MCIIAVAYRAHAQWPLIVAANRDEFHERPSEALKMWDTDPAIIAGRDAIAGGTWLGVTETGRFAAVSNVRRADPSPPTGVSRGKLVLDFLLTGGLPSDSAAELFNPFNLIAIDADGAEFVSNRPQPRRVKVTAGVHAFSNGPFDDEWPKTQRLNEGISARLSSASLIPDDFFELLYADAQRDTGASAVENAIFVRNPAYGTRCSTVMAVDSDGKGQIVERRFDPAARMIGQAALTFSWPAFDR